MFTYNFHILGSGIPLTVKHNLGMWRKTKVKWESIACSPVSFAHEKLFGLYIPMRASVFCLKLSLGVAMGSVLVAVVVSESEGSGELAVGMDLVMARKSWMSLYDRRMSKAGNWICQRITCTVKEAMQFLNHSWLFTSNLSSAGLGPTLHCVHSYIPAT